MLQSIFQLISEQDNKFRKSKKSKPQIIIGKIVKQYHTDEIEDKRVHDHCSGLVTLKQDLGRVGIFPSVSFID